jgi:DNA-binding NtrC family response regulator
MSPIDLEGRLFGAGSTSRGASRGADGTEIIGQTSALLAAAGGTLFLTGILDAPARVQARLARVLRDREAKLAGGGRLIELTARTITAVESGIESAVTDGRLRRDLFGRLAHTRIELPPFRRRREDLPQLAAAIMHEVCASRGIAPKGFTRAALTLIAALPWRENGRGMRALLESVAATVAGAVVQLEDVLAHAAFEGGMPPADAGLSLRDAKLRFERECITAVLARHHGRMGEAAKALGIQRTNLYRKVRQLNVARAVLAGRK